MVDEGFARGVAAELEAAARVGFKKPNAHV